MESNYSNDFKMMGVIHYALLFGILLFAAVVYFIRPISEVQDGLYDIFRYAIPAVAIFAVLGGRFICNPIFSAASQKESLGEKLDVFRTGMIIRWALVEGAALFAIVAYMLTNNFTMLIVAISLAVYMLTLRPTPETAGAALKLSESEYRALF